jgi:hypothetical protein
MDEKRFFGYCKNCGEKITDESEEYYISDDGEVFCCVECICEHLCLFVFNLQQRQAFGGHCFTQQVTITRFVGLDKAFLCTFSRCQIQQFARHRPHHIV